MQLVAPFQLIPRMTTSQQLSLGDVGLVTTREQLLANSGLIEGVDSVLQKSGANTIVRIAPSDPLCRLDASRKLFASGCKLVLLDGSNQSFSELQSTLSDVTNLAVFNRTVPGFEARSLPNAEALSETGGYLLGTQAGNLAVRLLQASCESLHAANPQLDEQQSIAKKITKREKQCLQWIALGKTSKEIAEVLAIAETTVNFHLRNAFAKLNASNRVHLVAKAVSLGIVSPIH